LFFLAFLSVLTSIAYAGISKWGLGLKSLDNWKSETMGRASSCRRQSPWAELPAAGGRVKPPAVEENLQL